MDLREFQTIAVRELLSRLETARLGYRGGAGQRQAVGLTATTGAGKTVIATAVIEAVLFGSDDAGIAPDPNAVFLWMTDLPDLNKQTQGKMLDASSELTGDRLVEIQGTFNDESLSPGKVYFLNTQKLGAKADLVKQGPLVKRNFTFWDVMRKTIEDDGRTLYLVVDEAHRGMVEAKKIEEANSIIQRFIKGYPEGGMPAVPIVLGISATAARFLKVVDNSGRTTARWDVPVDDVRESGLIKERTLAFYADEKQRDAMALFPQAVETWNASTQKWAAYHQAYGQSGADKLVVPALIIQVENEAGGKISKTDLDALIRGITAITGPLPDSAFAHAFGEGQPEPVSGLVVRYLEPPKIARDTDARVIFFKTSLGTGWDCPRAEVLFSFRRAVDPTSIAQTIGRMVRTPLARRIEENDELNSAYAYLPYYDKKALERIVAHLNESGNEAIAGTLKEGGETVSLRLRKNQAEVVVAIEAVPSYLVPTERSTPEIRVLANLANFLSRRDIDRNAFSREMGALAEILAAKRANLAGDADFQKEVKEQGEIMVAQATLRIGDATFTPTGASAFAASDEGINRVYASAAQKLTGEVANAYVRLRLKKDLQALGTARREAYALSIRGQVTDELNRAASVRIDALRQAHGLKVEALAPAQLARYKSILRQAPDPSPATIKLPSDAVFTRGADSLERHVYADPDGEAPIKLNNWEADSVRAEMEKPGAVAWLRMVEREGWALCVPWREGNTWRGFYPDFLFVREEGDRLVVDIIDPHDHTKPDAVGKAKGLSVYAQRHADKLGHIDLIARIGTRYCRLHLEKSAIRKQVDALAGSVGELKNLYLREG